jgi:ATP-dependent Clp protease ATP-binding subunit ClpX
MGFGADIKSKKQMRLGEILAHVTPDDLVQYGMIPEFVGRFPVIATLDDLTEEDLVKILSEPKNALIKQYKKLFELDNVQLEIEPEALTAIARKALARGTGARALRSVFEEVMMDAMFELPSSHNVEKVIITAAAVEGKEKPRLVMREIA